MAFRYRDTLIEVGGASETVPGGVPVIENSTTLLPLVAFPTPLLTMYSVVVELRDWTGCTEAWVAKGPKDTRSNGEDPTTISFLLITQYWAPISDVWLKSFTLKTTLSSLIPRIGWSGRVTPAGGETEYWFQVPVGSLLVEAAKRTWLLLIAMIEVNHLPLDASNWIFGSERDDTPQNEASVNLCITVPIFESIKPSRLTISTTWFGPAATWTSGGVHAQL